MTIGTIDFMIRSGFKTPIDAILIPDLAVPYAAPRSIGVIFRDNSGAYWRTQEQ